MLRKHVPDLLIVVGLFVLPLLFFAPVTLGGRTQIPADNLYQYEPWKTARESVGVPEIPHNALLSDLVLENYQWKSFIRQSISDGTIPLWQPEQFAGTPFLAAGQHSALYPFSLIYYILPLPLAYGWFTVSQLWLAGVLMFVFARGLGVGRFGGAVSGIAYQFSAFFIVSVVFPMMIAGAAWLPLLLLMIEFVIQRRPQRGDQPSTIPWVAVGAVALMMNIFAGHVEITYYTLIIMAYYAAARLIWAWWRDRKGWRALFRPAIALLAMMVLGLGLGAAQFIPLYELGTHSFRQDAADLDTVRGYALPNRHVLKFLIPNVYGSPAHHEYRDVFSGDMVQQDWQRPRGDGGFDRVTSTEFGIKNYVEGGAYMGVLVMVLAGIGLVARSHTATPIRFILALLALISLTFAFGLPTYALLYDAFPNINQLHTPFRWVWPLTFCVAALAGCGADALTRARREHEFGRSYWQQESVRRDPVFRAARWVGWGLIVLGMVILAGLLISRIAYDQFEPLVERIYHSLARANEAFPDARSFYSYEFWNVLLLGLFTTAAGIVIRVARCPIYLPKRLGGFPIWQVLAILVIALDLMIAGWNFNPSADPAWLDYKPASVAWLQTRMAEEGPFRYTTFSFEGQPFHANSTWVYGLHDVRGYDSLIPLQYADYTKLIMPQYGLLANRIDPISPLNRDALASPLLDILNVRYVVTDGQLDAAEDLGYTEVYADEAVRIYENSDVLPRAYTLPYYDLTEEQCGAIPDSFASIISSPDFTADPRRVVIEGFPDTEDCDLVYLWPEEEHEADPNPATIMAYGSIEVVVDADVEQESWLVLADSYYPGWKAFVDGVEQPIYRANHAFRAVTVPADASRVEFVFRPGSVLLGAVVSAFAWFGLLSAGAGLWRRART